MNSNLNQVKLAHTKMKDKQKWLTEMVHGLSPLSWLLTRLTLGLVREGRERKRKRRGGEGRGSHPHAQPLFYNSISFHCLSTLILPRESNSNNSILNNFPVIGPCSTGVVRGTCLAMHGALVTVGTSSTGAVYVYHLNGKWGNQVHLHIIT